MTNENNYNVEAAAERMYALFTANIYDDDGGSRLYEPGFLLLQEEFSKVPEQQRAYVYVAFISLLSENGYAYDVLQFIGEEDEDTVS